MSLYLSPYIGAGVKGNPFRPTGIDNPGSSAIDIRLDPTVADGGGIGFAVLWLPSGIPDPAGSIKIADDYGDLLTSQQRTRLNRRTGLNFGADTTIQDAIETIVLRPPTGRWYGLQPSRGRMELWLGSSTGKRRWVDFPVIAGGSITDGFNRANETPIASPWVEQAGSTGDINLSSSAITKSSAGDLLFYHNNSGGGWNADQSSQFTYATSISSDDWGPAIRISSLGTFDCYFYNQYTGGGVAREIAKFVNGTLTTIEAASGTGPTVGHTYKIDVAGSTIRYYDNGSENGNSPGTDTSLSTAGNGPGAFYYASGGSLDDFVATGEISAGGGAPHLLPLLGVGGLIRVAALARLHEPVDRRTLAKLLGAVAWGPK